jgi:hypothetical protein
MGPHVKGHHMPGRLDGTPLQMLEKKGNGPANRSFGSWLI